MAVCVLSAKAFAQMPKSYRLDTSGTSSLPPTNAVNDIVAREDTIWFGTELGLSLTTDRGSSWKNFAGTSGFDSKGTSALAVRDSLVWTATGYTTSLAGQNVQTGGGLYYSTDRGSTWTYIPQPIDYQPSAGILFDTITYGSNTIRALAITVPQQNITFDIALAGGTVWTASWAGMLRKSTDLGATWQRVVLPPDNLDSIDTSMTLDFDLSPVSRYFTLNGRTDSLIGSYNYSLFSLYASDDGTIWAGSAGGINKSTDGGISWRKFSHQNQIHAISGNFVVALRGQRWRNTQILWAATVNANDTTEIKGVSFTEDGGQTWKTTLLGEWAHNIATRDSLVYVVTDNGVFRSSDFGESWVRSGTIYDALNLQRFVSTAVYAVDVQGDTVWIGGPEGIAYTIDSPSQPFGSEWHILRTAEQVFTARRTYAFPNPFSPAFEPVRIHYSLDGFSSTADAPVTIRIFDFSMQPVRTLLQNANRRGGQEYDEVWNGRSDKNAVVANGVYFYRVEIEGQSPLWGKILVVR
jgi:hypothetical protein